MDAAVEVHVQLQVGPDSIAGSITPPSGPPTAFVGWLGLIDAVERLQGELTGRGVEELDRGAPAEDDREETND